MVKTVARTRGRLAKLMAAEGVPYNAAMKLLRGREVKVNGKRVNADIICEKGDLIEIYLPERQPPSPVYIDENIAVFDKPQGVETDAFLTEVRRALPCAEAVHRLDRNTSGILVFALNAAAKAELDKAFKGRTIEKYYLAEVKGRPEKDSGTLTAFLEKDAEKASVYIHPTRQKGDVPIVTKYRVLSCGGVSSVLEVELVTGRTHQIRAHLAYIGHPIIGDGKYGDAALNARMHAKFQRLQARRIVFRFSGGPLGYLDGKEIKLKAAVGKDEDE